MTAVSLADSRVQSLVEELCGVVRARYPNAEFESYEGGDRDTVCVNVYTEAPLDCLDINDVVGERVTEIIENDAIIIVMLPVDKSLRRP